MSRPVGPSRGSGACAVLLLAFVLVVCLSPALHTEDCAPGSATHCAACLASPIVSQAEPVAALAALTLPPAEGVALPGGLAAGAMLAADTPGRAPPA